MKRAALRLVAGVAVALALVGCVGGGAVVQDRAAGDLGYLPGSGTAQLVPANHRPHISLTGKLLTGGQFDLSSYAGRVVVVNFWASWCGDCRAESQYVVDADNTTRALGVAFVGVDVRDQDAAARAYLRTHHIDYPSVVDRDAVLALRFKHIPPTAIPSTVLLDRNGREAGRFIGPVLYSRLVAAIRALAGEPA